MTLTPFVGLKPFDTAQADFFFGREREIPLVINNLVANRLTLLYAESGAGKSSLLNAGVAPELARQSARELERDGVPSRVLILFREWQVNPLVKLLETIDHTLCDLLGLPYPDPPTPPTEFSERLHQWTDAFGFQILLILDQFEEYFIYPHAAETGPGSFFYEFVRAVNDPTLHATLMLSIREDALARLDRFEGHIPILFHNLLRIEPLTKEAGRQAICGPVQRYNALLPAGTAPVMIQDATVEAILADVEEGKVALAGRVDSRRKEEGGTTRHIQAPYLQLVMEQLWAQEVERDHAAEIRLATYERMGRARQITGEHLDRILAALTPGQQAVAAAMFRFLVTASGSKIAQSAEDLKAAVVEETDIPPAEVAQRVETVLALLSSGTARILKADSDGRGTTRYEIFHDVLGASILDWRRAYEERAAQQAALARQEAEAASARQRIQQLSAVVVVVLIALVGAVGLAIFAFQQQSEARTAQTEANAKTIVAQNAQATAVAERARAEEASEQARAAELLALEQVRESQSLRLVNVAEQQLGAGNTLYGSILATEALTHSPGLEAFKVVHRALGLPQRARFFLDTEMEVWSLLPSPDGSHLLTTATDGTMAIWDLATGTQKAVMQHGNLVQEAVWDEAGQRLLTASRDGTAGLWDAESGERLLTLTHGEAVIGAAWDPDERRILTASWDGTVGVWDARSGEKLLTLRHGAAVTSALWDGAGRHILTASEDGTAGLWDAESGERHLELTHDGAVFSAAWVGEGERAILTASHDGSAGLWDSRTGGALLRLRHGDGPLLQVGSNHDGTELFTVAWNVLTVWDVATGAARLSLPSPTNEPLTSAGWGADGRHILASSGHSATVWDAEAGTPRFTLQHQAQVSEAVWGASGRRILTASEDGTAVVWDIRTGERQVTLQHESGGVKAVWVGEDRIVTVALDGEVGVWGLEEPGRPPTLATGTIPVTAQWSPDERRILTSANDGTLGVWDAKTGEQLFALRHELWAESALWSADGSRILTASGDNTAGVWDATSGERLLTLVHEGWVGQALWSPDERLILTASGDQTAALWDAESGERLHLLPHENWVEGGKWSTDGSHVLTFADDGTTGVWDAATGERVTLLHHGQGAKARAVWSADGSRILTASYDGTVGVWDAETGERLLTLRHALPVGMATWDKDEQRILSASEDGTAGVWDAETGEQLLSLGHDGAVSQASWSPDERLILTASADQSIGVWDAESGEPRFWLNHQGVVDSAVWSREGTFILSIAKDHTLAVWDVATGHRVLDAGRAEDFTGVQWSQDEQHILTAAQDGHVGILVNDPRQLYWLACEEIPRPLSDSEWEQFLPSEDYRATCPPYSRSIGAARQLALAGDYEGALARLIALLVEPSLLAPDGYTPLGEAYPALLADPEAYVKRYAVPALWGQGRALAAQGNITEATARFRAALELDPTFLNVEPATFAQQVAAGEK